MLKTAGLLLILGGSAGLGFAFAGEVSRRQKALETLLQFVILLKGETAAGGIALPEAFFHIGGRLGGAFGEFLCRTAGETQKREGESFGEIFQRCAGAMGITEPLTAEEENRFFGFGSQLGYADAQTQKKQMELYERELTTALENLRAEAPGKKKLCRSMGIYGGILLAILLF